jgi:hypothetical protein
MRFFAFGALVLAAFAFWHTGSRAGTLCLRERFVSSGDLSLWPPGARCTFGLPSQHDTFINPWFLATAFVLAVVFVLFDTVRSSRAAGPSRA